MIKKLISPLTTFAQNKLQMMIKKAVQEQFKKRMEKLTRRLAIQFVITGVAFAVVKVLTSRADTIAGLLTKPKK
ncbi:hypothetical protein [Ruminococcus sp.]|uniref:hypothetical protein n=1 Tax=Ruminococcus sp. TaxID=41978 RepID=UPI002E7FBC3C|nr:hypothetical protein [Ruminococcus sp.]MEE3492829.1 hypothetical protein [Ruminococcus sp.]